MGGQPLEETAEPRTAKPELAGATLHAPGLAGREPDAVGQFEQASVVGTHATLTAVPHALEFEEQCLGQGQRDWAVNGVGGLVGSSTSWPHGPRPQGAYRTSPPSHGVMLISPNCIASEEISARGALAPED